MNTQPSMTREIGTAFAVLAIYLLTILAPLHQVRASQLAFEKLGYSTIQTSWVLCTPTGATGEDRDSLVSKCPAAGIGKHDLVLPVLAAAAVVHDNTAPSVRLELADTTFIPRTPAPPLGPRGPPVLV